MTVCMKLTASTERDFAFGLVLRIQNIAISQPTRRYAPQFLVKILPSFPVSVVLPNDLKHFSP